MSAATMTAQLPHETVWTLATDAVVSKSLRVIAELGVADHIGDDPLLVSELGSACEANADALDRLLSLLATYGVFERLADGYRHTDASRLLRSDHPMSMRPFARLMGLPIFEAALERLQDSVRTGLPSTDLVTPTGWWPYLHEHPREFEIFGQAMTSKAAADVATVLAAYDFGKFDTIADIGGGNGHLLRAVLDSVPSAEGILFELPDVVDKLSIDRQRLTARAGDFFVDPLPTADGYILMDVLHDWGNAESAAILKAIHQAASRGARVLIIENVLGDVHSDRRGYTLDVIMLVVTGGRERTGEQLGTLLRGAGFTKPTVIDTAGPLRIVEAIAG
jgi:C-methyltransferase